MLRNPTTLVTVFRAISHICLALLSCAVIHGANAQQQNLPAQNEARDSGIKLYRQGDTKGAIAKLRAASKKTRNDPEVWYYLGLALTRDGQIKDAGKAFESSLKAEPNFVNAHAGLAFILLLRNKLPDALSEGQRALKGNPNLVDAHYIVGVVWLRTGETAKARAEADTAIRINPQYARAYLLKSQALVMLSDETHSDLMPREKLLATYKGRGRQFGKISAAQR